MANIIHSNLLCSDTLDRTPPIKRRRSVDYNECSKRREIDNSSMNISPLLGVQISPKYGIILGAHLGHDSDMIDDILDNCFANECKYKPLGIFLDENNNPSAERRQALYHITEIAVEHKLNNETLFLAIHYFERYYSVTRLTGFATAMATVCLVLAAKVEETRYVDPKNFISGNFKQINGVDYADAEHHLMAALNYNCTSVTVEHFWNYWKTNFGVELNWGDRSGDFAAVANYLWTVMITNNHRAIFDFKYSLLVASSVYLAHFMVQRETLWTGGLERMTGYKEHELLACATELWITHLETKSAFEINRDPRVYDPVQSKFSKGTGYGCVLDSSSPPSIESILFKRLWSKGVCLYNKCL